jgi:hypothetical protein
VTSSPDFIAAENDREASLVERGAWTAWELATLEEAPTCGICDGIHGSRCPIEDPDPMYYANELAAGR